MKKTLALLLSLCCIGTVWAQQVTVTGTVTDNSGEPLTGAYVSEKGTNNGAITGLDGNFSLQTSAQSVLVVSYIGFLTQEVPLNGRTRIDIRLEEDSEALEEVVVVGYGTQKKVNLTGAVANVKIDEQTASRSITNVSSGLAGLVPGLVVSQTTGFAGGDGASLKIRGLGSINNSDPLIVVDGMPDVDINRINMNDVESISVLKDAASSAVYGSRAANGVILITTKNGSRDAKAKVSYNGSYSWSEPSYFYEYLADYSRALTLQMRAAANGYSSQKFREGTIEQWMAMSLVDPILFPNTNQFDESFRTAHTQSHTVSASGGNDRMNFYTSVGIMDQEGLQIHNDYKRYNFRFNMDYKIRDNIKVGMRADGQWTDRKLPRGAGLEVNGLRYTVSGVLNVHPETGQYGGAMAYGENSSAGNAVSEYEAYKSTQQRKEFNGNAYLEWGILKDLSLNVSYALRYYNQQNKDIQNVVPQWDFQTGTILRTIPDSGDRISQSQTDGYKTLLQARLNYDKEIARGHHLSAMLVAAQEYWYSQNFGAGRTNRIHSSLEELNAASAAHQTNYGSSESEGLLSYIGRVNYNLFERYLFEANFRYDGSSRFAEGHRWGFFPSAAFGWRISEENFFAPVKRYVTNAKFRLSYGSLGNNSGVGRYEQKETMSTTNYILGDSGLATGFSANKMINRELSWEETRVFNAGLDLGFLRSRLTAEIDFYNRMTSGMIRGTSISSLLTGYDAPRANVADLQNTGVELNLNWHDQIGSFNYGVNFNMSYNKNILKEWGDHLDRGYTMIDMPYHFLYIYEAYPGLVQSWNEIYDAPAQGGDYIAPGDVLLKDLNGDGKITDLDKRANKGRYRDTPVGQFGLTLTAGYKGFDLQALFQGNYGRSDNWSDLLNTTSIPADRYAFQQMHWDNAWTLDNRDALRPRLITGSGGSNNSTESTFSVYSTNYFRLKNLQLGYSFPARWINVIGIDRARLFVSAENLFTLTSWKGIDPEKPTGNDPYPLVRNYSIGLNIDF